MFVDSFPNHNQHRIAKNRFEEIEQSILDTMPKIEDTTTTIEVDTLGVIVDSTINKMPKIDYLFKNKDTINPFEKLMDLDIQLDSNFRKSQFLRPTDNKSNRR